MADRMYFPESDLSVIEDDEDYSDDDSFAALSVLMEDDDNDDDDEEEEEEVNEEEEQEILLASHRMNESASRMDNLAAAEHMVDVPIKDELNSTGSTLKGDSSLSKKAPLEPLEVRDGAIDLSDDAKDDKDDSQHSRGNRNSIVLTSGSKPKRPSFFAMRRRPSTRSSISSSSSALSYGKKSSVSEYSDSAFSGTDWEEMTTSASAALVAAGSTAASRHRRTRYSVGERVLVILNILNNNLPQLFQDEENVEEIYQTLTMCPVNRFGYSSKYSSNKSSNSEEHRPPYAYVLATVKKVHFEEDAQYYTVTREDAGINQRADSEWMEPITSRRAVDAAVWAAKQSVQLARQMELERSGSIHINRTLGGYVSNAATRTKEVLNNTVGRSIANFVRASKIRTTDILYGNSPFACYFHLTTVNFLVLCSFTFCIIDQVTLAMFPKDAAYAMTVLSLVIWIILALELCFEALVRPDGYFKLIESERAFAPSTARFISRFHLVSECVALLLFIPEFRCIPDGNCGDALPFSLLEASLASVIGPTRFMAFMGHLCFGLLRLRVFSLVRHWKKMQITHLYVERNNNQNSFLNIGLDRKTNDTNGSDDETAELVRKKKNDDDDLDYLNDTTNDPSAEAKRATAEEDLRLNQAATIGTALMTINSQRAMLVLVAIVSLFPLLNVARENGGANISGLNMLDLLYQNNLAVPNADEQNCAYLEATVTSWLQSNYRTHTGSSSRDTNLYLLWAQVLPVRCPFQDELNNGVITTCSQNDSTWTEEGNSVDACTLWDDIPNTTDEGPLKQYFSDELNIRTGVIISETKSTNIEYFDFIGDDQFAAFNVTVMYNQVYSVNVINYSSIILQLSFVILLLAGLSILRADAGRLVLDPLRKMLKIVVRYASNPLTEASRGTDNENNDSDRDDDDDDGEGKQTNRLGSYETEQLISAIGKITDLLRKCWGVAGAGIISSNLRREQDGSTVVFNATVPGKRIYALFGFAAINDFGLYLRALDKDVMILINDVAKVLHDEVYRWGFGDSGQCNKNLGAAFLMVFRIGGFEEVQAKKARATDVIFSSAEKRTNRKTSDYPKKRFGRDSAFTTRRGQQGLRRRRSSGEDDALTAEALQLASLPGIVPFTDRAVLGFLKCYAGIHRDQRLKDWKKDFRLGLGVGAFSVEMIFGMDAGWAVEGAVGSEYKIDATYLSPHVNMASRMMAASKQYGVSMLMSQAVEELLSEPARQKMRHLDTVFVKGSSIAQKIYTYDCRHKGVDFFLLDRSPEQADLDSERYTSQIWNQDPDLLAMRKHVTVEFEDAFAAGLSNYLDGDWKHALPLLKKADKIMIETVVEEGWVSDDVNGMEERLFNENDQTEEIRRLRQELGDGAARSLIAYIEEADCKAPNSWKGVRPLTSK